MSDIENFQNDLNNKINISAVGADQQTIQIDPSIAYENFWNASSCEQTNNDKVNEIVIASRNPHSLEERLMTVDSEFENHLKTANVDFEKLQRAVYHIIRIRLRDTARSHQEYISNMRQKVTATAELIRKTHNDPWSVMITVGAAAVGVGISVAGLSFLLPASVISAETAKSLGQAAMASSGLSSSLASVGGIPKDRQEGIRGVLQIDMRQMEEREQDRKRSKQSDNENSTRARDALADFERMRREAMGSILVH